jgi:hypothetical protein
MKKLSNMKRKEIKFHQEQQSIRNEAKSLTKMFRESMMKIIIQIFNVASKINESFGSKETNFSFKKCGLR